MVLVVLPTIAIVVVAAIVCVVGDVCCSYYYCYQIVVNRHLCWDCDTDNRNWIKKDSDNFRGPLQVLGNLVHRLRSQEN
jgi:hypothetical protein